MVLTMRVRQYSGGLGIRTHSYFLSVRIASMSGISSGLFAEDWYEECEETRQQAAQAAIRYIDIYSIYFNRGWPTTLTCCLCSSHKSFIGGHSDGSLRVRQNAHYRKPCQHTNMQYHTISYLKQKKSYPHGLSRVQ